MPHNFAYVLIRNDCSLFHTRFAEESLPFNTECQALSNGCLTGYGSKFIFWISKPKLIKASFILRYLLMNWSPTRKGPWWYGALCAHLWSCLCSVRNCSRNLKYGCFILKVRILDLHGDFVLLAVGTSNPRPKTSNLLTSVLLNWRPPIQLPPPVPHDS